MKKLTAITAVCLLCVAALCAQEVVRGYAGSAYLAKTNRDVSVYATVSPDSVVNFTLAKGTTVAIVGADDKMTTVDGKKGYWLAITKLDKDGDVPEWSACFYPPYCGWVFSAWLEGLPKKFAPSMMTATLNPIRPGYARTFNVTVSRFDGTSASVSVYAYQLEDQDFFTFSFTDELKQARYCDPVGTFKWYPETGAVERCAYLGGGEDIGQTGVTDDGSFYYALSGRSAVKVIDNHTGEEVSGFSYYEKFSLNGNIFSGHEWYAPDYPNYPYYRTPEEAKKLADQFCAKTPIPADIQEKLNHGLLLVVLVGYDYNLETGEKTYTNCFYGFTD